MKNLITFSCDYSRQARLVVPISKLVPTDFLLISVQPPARIFHAFLDPDRGANNIFFTE